MSRPALLFVAIASLLTTSCGTDSPLAPPVTPVPGDPSVARRWSDPATWPNGVLPAAASNVLIPVGTTMLLDTVTPALSSLRVEGTLRFDEKDVTLESQWILVKGALEIGTEAQPFVHRATIILSGNDSTSDGTGLNVGSKVLVIGETGRLDLHGRKRTTWARLASTATKGATQIVLDRATDWAPGDRLTLASTDYDPLQAEEALVSSVNGTTLTLASPLTNMHFGELQTVAGQTIEERGEVGLLTHNVVVRGDSSSLTTAFGGHLFIMRGASARIEGVEFTLMGQRKRLARYPVHWHMASDVPGQYARDNAIWRTFNRCLTIHGTHQLTVERNVCYDNLGHGIFMEDGIEHGNTVASNLVMLTRVPNAAYQVLPSDASAASYWITNPDNTYRGNVAAGSQGFGFWFAMPVNPTGMSTTLNVFPRRTPIREFSGNVAHSNRRTGLNVDDMANADGTTSTASYGPRQDPANASSPAAVVSFAGFVGYKHAGRAVWLRGSNLRLTGAILADNGIGATFASSETFVQDALFVGETANKGPSTLLSASFPIRGYEYYDGRVGAERVTFANYVSNATRPASGLGFNRSNGFNVSSGNYASALTFVNANGVYLEDPKADKDGDKSAIILDADGTLSGAPGNVVVANNPLLRTSACTARAEWNAYVCPLRFVALSVSSLGSEAAAPLTITRDDAVLASFVGTPNDPGRVNTNLPSNRSYTVISTGQTMTKPRFSISRVTAGDWITVSTPFPNAAVVVYRDGDPTHPFAAVGSKAEVDASAGDKYYRNPANGVVYLKLMPKSGQTSVSINVQ